MHMRQHGTARPHESACGRHHQLRPSYVRTSTWTHPRQREQPCSCRAPPTPTGQETNHQMKTARHPTHGSGIIPAEFGGRDRNPTAAYARRNLKASISPWSKSPATQTRRLVQQWISKSPCRLTAAKPSRRQLRNPVGREPETTRLRSAAESVAHSQTPTQRYHSLAVALHSVPCQPRRATHASIYPLIS
jgi:hypothetical protein